jgi:hypothetical protein
MRVAGETRGGRTSVFLIDVPQYSTHLNIRINTSYPEGYAAPLGFFNPHVNR